MSYKIAQVLRPENGKGNKTVTLTATVSRGSASGTKQFQVTVIQQGMSDIQSVNHVVTGLAIDGANAIMGNIALAVEGYNGTAIKWSSSNPAVISANGFVVRPSNGSEPVEVILTATVTKGAAEEIKEFTCTVMPWTSAEEVQIAHDALTFDSIKGGNSTITNILTNLNLVTTGLRNATISWDSTVPATISEIGAVTRPTFAQGDITVTLTATINVGEEVLYKQFVGLRVIKNAETNLEAVNAAKAWLTEMRIIGSNVSLAQITQDMPLPKVSDALSSTPVQISWAQVKKGTTGASAYISVVDMGTTFNGDVIRPDSTEANETITLTATFSSTLAAGTAAIDTKVFEITIQKQTE